MVSVVVLHGEVSHSRLPFIAELDEDGRDEAKDGCFIGEQGCDSCSAFDLLVLTFEHIGGSQAFAMVLRELKDRETFGQIGLGPSRQLR